jgi:hypothetical protein
MRLSSARRSSGSRSTDPEAEGASGRDRAWAGVRFDPARAEREHRGHVESWFLKANDPQGRRAVWLKWTLWAGDRAPARAVAETWAVAFGTARGHVATKSTVPFEQARFVPDALGVTIDGCALSSDAARGAVASGGRAIAYDLAITSLEAPYTLYGPRWMYTGPIPSQKAVSPIPNARLSGTVEVDGERWSVDAWPGMVGHNWGRHTELYVWGHCNTWDDGDDVVFEGASGRLRAAGVLLPLRTGMIVRHHGTTYRLSSLASVARNKATVTPRRWEFRGSGPRVEVEGEMWAETDDFVGLFYPNPDGALIHCLNSKIAHAELTLRIAGRAPKTLRSTRSALEIGTTDPHHGVRMYV